MGVLTDFVIADPSDAERVGESSYSSKDFGGLEAKGIDQVKLGTLYGILTGAPFNPSFMGDDESLLYLASDAGPLVQLVPPDLVGRLASLDDSELTRVAEKWAETEEFALSRWSPETVEHWLTDLAAIARKTVAEGKSLLMWSST
jgi:hypothetical protein